MPRTLEHPSPTPVETTIDIHQHLWPEEFLAALARRALLPRLRRKDGEWVVQLAGEPDAVVNFEDHNVYRRAHDARAIGLETVLVAPSSPLGVEALPAADAEALLAAYHVGVLRLPKPFRAWASAALDAPAPESLDALLTEGFVGLSLPAGALSDTRGLDRIAPLLDALERRGAPLLIHPGPAPWTPRPPSIDNRLPAWFPALTSYVGQLQTAWHLWRAFGRAAFPDLRVCFALLAGLAPLHHERLVRRGGPDVAPDPNTYYETSSYGPQAIESMSRLVGADKLIYGSDHPVLPLDPHHAEPGSALLSTSPDQLLGWRETA
jgi:hypothetical protein